ncbi:TIGR04222 domain-containing membrane protein [uncultured Sphingomonas sp.]|uniref:TIGR04222 domain-containing membrane protein n=1 Tax=uncultured Sphingomonas sp. TaxID=158754 RepID=UPI0025FFB570|nr:TIGR04222 domain-containing membrane protein [uncultured Sphingomonas sp.]
MRLNPLELTGGSFLALYGGLMVVAILASLCIPRLTRPGGWSGPMDDADHLALLGGGPLQLVDTVVTRLLVSGALTMPTRRTFAADTRRAASSDSERQVLALPGPIRWRRIRSVLTPYAARLEHELMTAGMMATPRELTRLRLHQTAPFLALSALGGAKWLVGVARDRPVGYLTFLLILTAILAALRWKSVDRATRAGLATLAGARSSADRLRRAPMPEEMDMAVALFSTGVLLGSSLVAYHQLRTASSGGGGGDGDGGGCGGGCGGCGS